MALDHANKYRRVTRSMTSAMAASMDDAVKRVPTATGGDDEGEQADPAKGSDEVAKTAGTTNTSTNEIVLPNGVKLPKGKWTPLTDGMIKDAATKPIAETTPNQLLNDDEVKKLDSISRAAGHDFSPRVLEFLAKDLPQEVAGSVSRKKMQQVMAEDLSIPKDQIESYDKLRAKYPSAEEMQKMSPAQVFKLLNDLQGKYPGMMRERVRAEEKLEEAEAKAKRDRANLEKTKREWQEKKEARMKKGKRGKKGAGADVVMGGMEEVVVVKKSEGGGGDGEGAREGTRMDGAEKMDLS